MASRVWPGGFGPPVAAIAPADSILVSVATEGDAVHSAKQTVAKAFIMPDGVVDVADFGTTSGLLVESADTTTGWAASFPFSGDTIAVDTVNKSQGTGSITITLLMDDTTASKVWWTAPTPVSLTGRTLIAFDFMYTITGSLGPKPTVEMVARVSDAVNLNTAGLGNHGQSVLPGVAEGVWATVVIPLVGLTGVKSVGLIRQADTEFVSVSAYRTNWWIDNIRFISETAVDQALGSAASVGVIVGPTYPGNVNQMARNAYGTKSIIDLANGRFTNLNNVIHLHDYFLDETGATDVSGAIGRIINSAQPGQIIRATAGATYRFDGDVYLHDLRGVTIDFTGATGFLTYQSNTPFILLDDCESVTMIGGEFFGYRALTHNGSAMFNVAGTPTVSGTTKLLDALSEEVRLLDNSGVLWHWGRVLPQQVGLTDDGLGPRNYWGVTLSDSAQIANDCVVTIRDELGTIVATYTLTLTATPTVYPIWWIPTTLRSRLTVHITKATASVNTITVTSAVSYGRVEYQSSFDIASGVVIASSRYVTLRDMWLESFGGDGIQCSDGAARFIHVDNCVSRACRRQGMSFNRGQDYLLENLEIGEPARSGIDFEPFASNWTAKRFQVLNIRFYNVTNFALAMSNFARNLDFVIDGVEVYEAALGVVSGGMRGGVFRNVTNFSKIVSPGDTDFIFKMTDVAISNIRSAVGIECNTNTNTYDDGSGSVVYAPTGTTLADIYLMGLLGGAKLILAPGYTVIGPVYIDTTQRANFTNTTNAFGPVNSAGQPFAGLSFGEYARQLPNTFKAPATYPSPWTPGGFDHFDEPVSRIRSLSGGAVQGNNLRGVGVAVAAAASVKAIAFPNRVVGTLSQIILTGTVTAGTLAASTPYYYRMAPRGRLAGPRTYLAQMTRTTGAAETGIIVEVEGWLDLTNQMLVEGFTLLRGTVNGGPYTARFDVIPDEPLHGPPGNGILCHDLGATLQLNLAAAGGKIYGYAPSYPVQVGSWTAAVDESGYEPDTNYMILAETNWDSGHPYVSAKTTAGFTLNFPYQAPGDGSGRVSWFLIR